METPITSNTQAAIDAGRMLATKIETINGTPVLITPPGYDAEQLPELRDYPIRIVQNTIHTTAQSFIDYCNRHATDDSAIFIDSKNNSFLAVLDHHGPQSPDWGKHRAKFSLAQTPEWDNWLKNSGVAMTQEKFGQFIETNMEEIVKPSGAEMLEIALSIQAKTDVKFSSAQRLDNGQLQLMYHEEINGTAGPKGQLKIPQTFEIGLQLYEGGEPYKIEARLRYRIKDGALTMWYELIRPHKTVKANLDDTEAFIVKNIERGNFYHGSLA